MGYLALIQDVCVLGGKNNKTYIKVIERLANDTNTHQTIFSLTIISYYYVICLTKRIPAELKSWVHFLLFSSMALFFHFDSFGLENC